MPRRRVVFIVGLSAIAAIIAYRHYSPESSVRRRIHAAARAFEHEKLLDLARLVSRRYADPSGFDYESVLGAAHTAFTSYSDLKLEVDIGQLNLSGDTATAPVSFRVTATTEGQSGSIAGSRSDPARAVLKLVKERGDWMLTSIELLDSPRGFPGISSPGGG